MKKLVVFLLFALLAAALPAQASEQFTYISQPESVTIFLNNIVFVTDTLTLAGGTDAQIILPSQIFQDTLLVWENDERVTRYSINRNSGQVVLKLPSGGADLREVRLEYLAPGLSWRPVYDLRFVGDAPEMVSLSFYAEIQNQGFDLESVETRLAAGEVNISQGFDELGRAPAAAMNQTLAGYDDGSAALAAGAVTIQHLYPIGALDSVPGDTLYARVLASDLPNRRVLLWNAATDQQVTVIFKVRNETQTALAAGIVRSYQDSLFIGSDPVEFTPSGSEGSITVGRLQDVRVSRAESFTAIEATLVRDEQVLHEVTLTMTSFAQETIQIEAVDIWPPNATDFQFSVEPQREPGNVLRWVVDLPPSETVTITYSYQTPR